MNFARWLKQVLLRGIADVPPAIHACESCREASCDDLQASSCNHRRQAELEERQHRVRDAQDASPASTETASSLRPFEITAHSREILSNPAKQAAPSQNHAQSGTMQAESGYQQRVDSVAVVTKTQPEEFAAVTKRSAYKS
jgi:hypothetical protein